jgi:predicted nuclease of predicted toxin-antitoxin system
MKLLLDTCIWGGAADELRMRGHDVVWSGNWDEDPGDEEILTIALAQGRILVTLDKDFGELAVVRRVPHCGILRIAGFPTRRQAGVIEVILNRHGKELERGAVITVEPGKLRIRPPDIDELEGNVTP